MNQVSTPQAFNLPGHTVLPEPKLRFGSRNPGDVDIHPLQGLLRFGPYSRDKLAALSDPIRVAVVAPAGGSPRVSGLIREMEQAHQPRERKAYLPGFPGFSKVFHVRLASAGQGTTIELATTLSEDLKRSPKPHVVLAEALTRALGALRNHRHDFDVVLVLLSKEWEAGFEGGEGDDFDLHDYVKAIAASDGLCIQFLKESSALDYFCRCSVMWRLGIALYTKAGGVPWVLADVDAGTAFIGIDYALRANAGADSRFAICCSQVFDAEGSGLEFVAYEADGVRMFGRNPFLRRDQMLKVMARSLAIYQRKHSGAPPQRVVVHKNTEFKREEIQEQLVTLLRSLTDTGFEELCARLLRHIGFENVKVTGRAGDQGVDGEGYLLINRFVRTKVMFQCKRYEGTVGPDKSRDFRGAIQGRAERGIFLTTGAFTRGTVDEAARENTTVIELVDIDRLLELMIEEGLGVKETRALKIEADFFKPYQAR
jgi:HJR/Mrr/RecB family endonuclease